MATCIDCIHQYCCKYDRFFGIDDVENKCNYFKNKADVIQVVRCKDCVNRVEFDTNKFHCELTGYYCGETGYCSDGTPKERGVE